MMYIKWWSSGCICFTSVLQFTFGKSKKEQTMANLNVRIDDVTKQQAFLVFEELGISPSQAVRIFLDYVAKTGKMPIRQFMVADDDSDLVEITKKRLAEPHKIRETTLDELFS